MKRLIGLIVGTILCLSSYAQFTPRVIDNIVDELIVKDGLVIEVHQKDSILVVYKQTTNDLKEQVAVLKLQASECEEILNNRDRLMAYVQAELKDKKREVRQLKIKNTLLTILAAAELVLVALVAL